LRERFFSEGFFDWVFFNRVAMRSRSVVGTDFFEGFVIGEILIEWRCVPAALRERFF
jgi:hypothetical protein